MKVQHCLALLFFVAATIHAETLEITATAAEIVAGETTAIELSYDADANRFIEVWLKDTTDSNHIRGQARLNVIATGGPTTVTMQIPVDADAPLHSSYNWSVYMAPIGGNWSNRVDDDWQPNNTVVAPSVVAPPVPVGPPGTRITVDSFSDSTIDFGPDNNGSPVWYMTDSSGVTVDLSSGTLAVSATDAENIWLTYIDWIGLDLPGDSLEVRADVKVVAAPAGGDQLFRLGLVNSSQTPLAGSVTTANDGSSDLADDVAYGVAVGVTAGTTALVEEGGSDAGLLQGADLSTLATDSGSPLQVGVAATLSLKAERIVGDKVRLTYTFDGGEVFSEELSGDVLTEFDSVAFTAAAAGLNYEVDNLIITANDQNALYNRYSNYPRHLEARKYNVLFIAVDDLKPMGGLFADHDHHSSVTFPNAQTPHMDRLASEGVNFRNNYCQVPVCGASRIATLTGLRPDSTLSWSYGDVLRDLRPDVVTLPQHFGAHGYVTHSIGKVFHHEDAVSWNDGYQRPKGAQNFYASPAAEIEDGVHPTITWGTTWGAYSTDCGEFERDGTTPVSDDSYSDGQSASAAETKIAEYAANFEDNGQPFFLAVGFHKPHLPYTAPKAYWDLYDPADIDATDYVTPGADTDPPLLDTYTMPTGTPRFTKPGNSRANSGEFNTYWDTNRGQNPGALYRKETAERLVHGYLACVSYADAQVGRLLDALEASGVADDTIIVLWSDHGWHLADHKGFWGKHSNYQQATVTPMVMKVPGMAHLRSAGRETWGLTELVDIYPTLLDLNDLPEPQMPDGLALEGSSLVPLIQDPALPWKRAAFSQYPETILNEKIDSDGGNRETFSFANPQRNVQIEPGQWLFGPGMGYSIRTQRYRYTEYWQTKTDEKNSAGYIINRHLKANNKAQIAELYDYVADPAETVNLIDDPDYASVVSELKAALAEGNGWTLTAVKQPGYEAVTWADWQDGHGTPGLDSSALSELADPDFDGLINLLEYRLGTNPFVADPNVPLTQVVEDGGQQYLSLGYPVHSERTDVSVFGEANPGLSSAGWASAGVSNLAGDAYGSYQQMSSRIPMSDTPSANFLRLKAVK